MMCTEVYDSEAVFGKGNYVGHDEPSALFYSNRPGSGNSMQYRITVPTDPAGAFDPSKSYSVELGPTFRPSGQPQACRYRVHGIAVLSAGIRPAVHRVQL
jgi:hypothetical protein